ncbi:basement membrane-specific heparan sulfate proteoglycan core protein [Discoglossus pictus]
MGHRKVSRDLPGLTLQLLLLFLLHICNGVQSSVVLDEVYFPEGVSDTRTAQQHRWGYGDLSDDEDFLADGPSGDDNGSTDVGSGAEEPTTAPSINATIYYRALVNFTQSIEYSVQLDNVSSDEFRELSNAIIDTLESEYYKIEGDQMVSVVYIKLIDGDAFVEMDVGSEGNSNDNQIREVLYSVVESGSIASYDISPVGFQFRRLGAVTPTVRSCTDNEFTCKNGDCVPLEFRCDQRSDCRDLSDEEGCDEGCADFEFTCTSGECVPDVYVCDGRSDCRDSSDELQCAVITSPVPQPRTTAPAVTTARPSVTTAQVVTRPPIITTAPTKRLTTKPPLPIDPRVCRRDEARCPNGQCIPRDYLCDGEKDCPDGSDESRCGTPSPCEPNEFKCQNGRCALKLWRCDGDNDCGDNSDELNCPTKGPSDTCSPEQFVCVQSRTCIPASYQCDEEADCPDRSDEIGCTPPQVITPPEESITASRGETVRFTCVAVGVPTPIITWRLNWGHIPTSSRVSMTSESGQGTLIIRDVKEADQGAYTCEAINARGMVFGIPDGVLILKPNRGPCPEGSFHVEGTSKCIPCFCFGVTKVCQASRRYRNQIRLRFDVPDDFKGVNVSVPSHPGIPPLSSNQLQIEPSEEEFQLVDLSRRFLSLDSFWTLPGQFLGNKVDSYGGSLSFKVRYGLTRGQSEPVRKSDVILVGNGQRLIYRVQSPTQPSIINQRKVQFTEENWQHESGTPVTREDLLMTLQNLENIMIQTVYDNKMASVGLSDIIMDTSSIEYTQLGAALSVEECRCPVGYSGLSCEVCAPQFERVREGPFLGTCSGCNCNSHANLCDPVSGYCQNCQHNTHGHQCNKCRPGFFGDPTKGTPDACRPCPCPHIDSRRRYSSTCFLDTDGQPTCDDCAEGYTGRRCEKCAEGYEGSPMQPGGRCTKIETEDVCDKKGSLDISNGACVCKSHVEGKLCNQCKFGTFYLSDKNSDGCLKCFCMGITRQCSSSFWNRDQVRSTYDRQERIQFTISNVASTRTFSDGIRVTGQSELTFSSFSNIPQDIYFWVLPEHFKGDKVTSYGGELRYTIKYEAPIGSEPLYTQPDVVLQGNGIFLEHYSKIRTTPGFTVTITVPFREHSWRRTDGQDATREHLLMALADIDLLMIRASHTERIIETRISNIHMDVAVPHSTGLQRAVEVEHCVCPTGYTGPSCQDCAIGYTRSTTGLYLGTCEPCQCGGHSSECDGETGECQNCQHNTEGTKCESCRSGFYGDPKRGSPTDCQPCPCSGTSSQYFGTCFLDADGYPTCDSCPPGYAGRQCERCAPGYRGDPGRGQRCTLVESGCRCDLRGSLSEQCDARGQCQCKPHVEGTSCSSCRLHHFYLNGDSPDGCLPCFCMGVTQQCTSSSYHRELITSPFLPGNFQSFALVNRQHSTRITTGFTVEMSSQGPQLTYNRFDELGQESYYWQLPEGYQGDKVASYGGKLRYTLSYNAGIRGAALPDADIQITGNDITLVAYQSELRPRESKSFEVVFRETNWKRPDGQQTTREHLMMVLADLDEILIRASYSTDMLSAGITGVSMETASPSYTSLPQALEVEECRCPPGYKGLSCQDCATGYTRTGGGLYLGHCELCDCNGHSDSCHPETGACSNCLHNTAGEFCDKCAPGFYGDATAGTPEDCQPCACPLTDPENQFSRTCEILGAGGYRCTACQPGYTGQYCERCAPGYTGNPNIRGQKCIPEDRRSQLVVRIHPQKAKVVQGGEVSLRCQVSGNPPYYFYWSREDGRPLPGSAQPRDKGEELHFSRLQPSDSGIYICTCRNLQYSNTSTAELIVAAAPSKPITVTVEEQRVQNVRQGADVTFICTAKSKSPAYTLVWTRQNNGKLPERAMDFNGILTIRNVQPEDAGIYICTGSNMFDMDEGNATLHVQETSQTQTFYGPYETMEGHRPSGPGTRPNAVIEPRQLTVQRGQSAEFRCIATGNPTPTVEWTGGQNGGISSRAIIQGGILRFTSVDTSDEGYYTCHATNNAGQHLARADLRIHTGGSLPDVQVSPERTEVREGDTARLYCRAGGSPAATITWKRQGGSLPSQALTTFGFLHFRSSSLEAIYRRILELQARTERTDISTLVIPSITASDGGTYLCVGTNSAGSSQARIEVTVMRVSGVVSPIRIESSSDSITEGQSVELNCLVTSHPHAVITWHRPGQPLSPNHQVYGSRLRILHASSADSGEYICRVTNGAGTQQASITITITRVSGPSHPSGNIPALRIEPSSNSIVEGQTLELNCVVASLPNAVVTWQRSGAPLSPNHQVSGSRLRILQASVADSGQYICRVTNGAITQQATITVTITRVSDPSYPSGSSPAVRIEPSSNSVAEGQTLELNCVVAGQPDAVVTWHRSGRPLSANHQVLGSRLRIVQASLADSGEYICRVTTGAGTRQASITVTITHNLGTGPSSGITPTIRIESPSNSLAEGQTVVLNCVVEGQAQQEVTWYRPGKQLSSNHQVSGSRLRIVQASPQDSGEYICRVSSSTGVQMASITVSIDRSSAGTELVPSVHIEPSSRSVEEGQTLELNCVINGLPGAVVTWMRSGGRPLARNHQVSDSRMRILQASPADSGEYICRVSTASGVQQASITVTILRTTQASSGIPSPILIEKSADTVLEGQTLELNCVVLGQPQATITWHRPGVPIARHQVSGSRLRIVQASSADSGEYICRYSSGSGSQEASVTVSVTSQDASAYRLKSPVISIDPHSARVRQGDNATFRCRIHDGAEPIRISWQMGHNLPLQDNVKISPNGSITIVGAHHKNQGAYRCVASNTYGVAQSAVNLLVQGRPSVSVIPHGPITVKVGDPINLECMGMGDPRPLVSWRRTGSRQNFKQPNLLPIDSNAVLQILSARPEDAGSYTCTGQNPAGTTQVQVEVRVEGRSESPDAPRVLADKPLHVVEAGKTATLNCSAEGNPTPTITWSKLRAPLPWQHQVVNNALVIPNVAQQDSGQFICNASNAVGFTEVFVTLDVENPPYATTLPDEISVSVGEVIQLQCLAHGTSPLKYQWTKVIGTLPDRATVRDNTLHISSATVEDAGRYRCVVSNKVGRSEAFAQVSVSGRPSVSVIPHGPITVKVGDPINLECVGRGDPRPLVSWRRTGSEQNFKQPHFLPIDSNAVLQILAARPEDAGSYTCTGQNPAGTTQVQVEVRVEGRSESPDAPRVLADKPLHVVEAGKTATLNCSAEGNPTPTITWSKLRAPLPWQHQMVKNTLVIPNVAQQDSGQYICNASNAVGFTEVFVTLDVENPPYATTLPDETSVSVGEVIQLQCLAHGTSPLKFQWTKVNGTLPDRARVHDSILHINLATVEDAGTYRCVVSNKVGRSEAFTQVSILAPFSIRVSPQIDTKAVGGVAEFTCSVIGDPQARIQWFKEGGELPPNHNVRGGVLRIPDLEHKYGGVYTCRASSRFGQAQGSGKLVIQALPKVMINVRTSVQTVLAGNSVEFECLAIGDPRAKVTWSKVGTRMPSDVVINGGILKIEQVKQSDAGQYRCTATTDIGEVQSHVILHVQSVPQIAAQPEMKEITTGSIAVFPCLASGFPVPEITWTKLEGDLPSDARIENNILTIASVKPEDAGTYVCTAANRQGRVTAFSMLKVRERVVPYFTGRPQSYLTLPSIKDAHKKFDIKITFRPDTADALIFYSGMLVYSGQKKTSGADFVSFGLVGGRPEFRFDAGSGMAIIRYPTPITLGEFHTVTLYRNLTQGSLVVDNQAPVNGTSQGKFQGLDLNEELFLGGYPNYEVISKTGLSSGFVGCVRQLIIQGEEVIFKDLDLSSNGISNCPTCRDRPCKNRGICKDSESSSYVCKCPHGFTGSNCEHSQALHCHPEACGPDATCINRADGQGYTCRCHLGKSGDKCMQGVMVNTPSFDGATSYISYPPLTNIHNELRIDLEFKPFSPDGLVFFSGGKGAPVDDFVFLAMAGGHLEFRYELGSGMAILRSAAPITLGQWHKLSAERLNKDGTLVVDNAAPVKRSSPGKSQGLNLKTLMYLGGVDDSVELPSPVNISQKFQGCIGEVSINGKKVDISYSFTESRSISQCYDRSPCDRMPCLHGGRCMLTGEYEFQCLCRDGFRGERCETHEDQCQIYNPCLNGGTCKDNRCHCPSGFSGTICEHGGVTTNLDLEWNVEGSGGNDAPGHYGSYFSDDSFVALPKSVFPRSRPDAPETIELEIRTTSSSGVVLWQGMVTHGSEHELHDINEEENEQGKGKDFISLGLKDGHLLFSYQLGSGEANILSEDPVNDGEWHKITAIREGKSGSIQVDGEEMVTGVSPGKNIMVNTKGSVYLGGAPNVKTLTGGKFLSGITGCIKNLVLLNARPSHQPHQPIDLKHHAEGGHNTKECPS